MSAPFCKLCNENFSSPTLLYKHYKIRHACHAGVRPLPCLQPNCLRTFRSFSSFKNHRSICKTTTSEYLIFYSCIRPDCTELFDSSSGFLSHLRKHVKFKQEVLCPFQGCVETLYDYGEFCYHQFKNHSGSYEFKETVCVHKQSEIPEPLATTSKQCVNSESEILPEFFADENVDFNQNDILQRLSTFLLQLQVIDGLSASCLQSIVSEINELTQLTLDDVRYKCQKLVSELGISDPESKLKLDEIFASPIVEVLSGRDGLLSTNKRRQAYFTKNLPHVGPGKRFAEWTSQH